MQNNENIQYGLISEDGKYKYFLRDDVSFIGRGESCNFQVRDSFLSSRHAKITAMQGSIHIEDLGSTNGIYVNKERVESAVLKSGDVVQIGKTKFQCKTQQIDNLKNKTKEGTSFFTIPGTNKQTAKAAELVKVKLNTEHVNADQTAFIQLDKIKFEEDIDEDFYIFEDDEDIYPILEESSQDCIEFIKMYKDTIISIEYLPVESEVFEASGLSHADEELHFDSLSSEQSLELITFKDGGKVVFTPLKGHENFVIRSGKAHKISKKIVLKPDDLIKVKKDDYSVNIKQTSKDYVLQTEPFGGRDRTFKICIVLGLVVGVFLYALSFLYTPKKKVLEKKKEVKVTKVIYKKAEPKKVVKEKPVEKVEPIKVKEKIEQSAKSVETKKEIKKVVREVTNKIQKTKKKPVTRISKRSVKKISKKTVKSKQKKIKKVDAFSDFSFSKDLKALKTNKKKSNNFGMKSAEATGNRQREQGLRGGEVSAAKSGSEVSKIDIGSVGEIANSKGIGSFGINKKTKFTKSYGKTVLLGSIDPEIIRELLRRSLPQFRYCYDDELRRQRKKVKGKMELDFVIGPNGRVGRSSISLQAFKMSSSGVRCMRTVLQSIRFPKPKGGGIVEVRQPIFLDPEY